MHESGQLTQIVEAVVTLEAPTPVPFATAFRRFREPGYRRFVGLWLLSLLVVVPSGLLTTLRGWTGIPVHIGGAEVYLTVYLPLLFCVPMVLWFGYWWGAVPAYLSTFVLALLSGMPLERTLLFALANPIGLAALILAFRALPMRTDLRSIPAALYFVMVAFIASIVGSAGSFVWAYTEEVGLNQLYPVWQGWWLGGFVQAVVLCMPLLIAAGPTVERWKRGLGVHTVGNGSWNRGTVMLGASTVIASIVAFVVVVRRFSFAALEKVLEGRPEAVGLRVDLENVMQGLSLPQWTLMTLLVVTLFFGFRIGFSWSTQYKALAAELEATNQKLKLTAITDPLTGAYNRGHLLEVLPREVSASLRHGLPLACLMLDLDHFKHINDRFGHLAGDDVLVSVAELIAGRLREEDVLARFGGEEFVVLMPQAEVAGARGVAEDIRRMIAELEFSFGSEDVRVTVSIGIAELADVEEPDAGRGLLALADTALYRAKRHGRDRLEVAGSERPEAVSA